MSRFQDMTLGQLAQEQDDLSAEFAKRKEWSRGLSGSAAPSPTPSEALADEELLAFINDTPVVLSLLYDLDLMPEQAKKGSLQRDQMLLIAAHFKEALRSGPPEGIFVRVTPRLWQALLDTRRLAGDENIAATWAERGPWAAWYYGVDEGQIVRQEMDILLAAASSGGKR